MAVLLVPVLVVVQVLVLVDWRSSGAVGAGARGTSGHTLALRGQGWLAGPEAKLHSSWRAALFRRTLHSLTHTLFCPLPPRSLGESDVILARRGYALATLLRGLRPAAAVHEWADGHEALAALRAEGLLPE